MQINIYKHRNFLMCVCMCMYLYVHVYVQYTYTYMYTIFECVKNIHIIYNRSNAICISQQCIRFCQIFRDIKMRKICPCPQGAHKQMPYECYIHTHQGRNNSQDMKFQLFLSLNCLFILEQKYFECFSYFSALLSVSEA